MASRVLDHELDRLEAALGHWRSKLVARQEEFSSIASSTLTYRHKAIVASAAMGLPDLCEEYAKPPHERAFP